MGKGGGDFIWRFRLGLRRGVFSHFLTDPDEEAVRVWIEDNVCFTDVFRQWGMEDYDQIIYEMDEFGEDPFHSFCMEFSPDTDKWEEFCEMYEEIKEYRPECEW